MKDDSLPYVYLDDDEDEVKSKKKSSGGKKSQGTGAKKKDLSEYYTYVDEEPKQKGAKKSPNKASNKTKKPAAKRSGASHKASTKRKKKSAAPAVISVVALVLIACMVVFLLDMNGVVKLGLWDKITGADVTPKPTNSVNTTSGVSWFTPDNSEDNDGLNASEGNSIQVSSKDLNITEGLNEDWLNILLLGTDSRVSYEASRSDTMMICSVNQKTGQVKLTSIMRDTAVEINGKTVKINTAYFYGGANLAMSTVNKYFGMNIDKYVVVNFSGFAKIVEALGGVEMDVAQNELEYLNHNVAEQYYLLYVWGEMEEQEAKDMYYATKIERAGAKLHLDGMQALGYARIRKADSDYGRVERQRKVLNALLAKMKGTPSGTILSLTFDNIQYVTTNLDTGTIVNLAATVLGNNAFTSAAEFRVPINGTYKEETRNNVSMLYDMNAQENIRALHMFIYEN